MGDEARRAGSSRVGSRGEEGEAQPSEADSSRAGHLRVKRAYAPPRIQALGKVSELTFTKSLRPNENPFVARKNG
jgi:hypothetical protein